MNSISGNLGKLCKYVKINENENKIAVIPITDWIDKKYWRRINDILSLRGFIWVPSRQQWEQASLD